MKRYIYAIIVTCLGVILLGLNTKQHNPSVPEITTKAVVEALQEPIAPEVIPEPIKPVEVAVEPVQEQTINQAQAGVTYSPNDCEQYRPILARYDWDITIAMAVMKAESGCRRDAFNPEAHRGCNGSIGLFQVACLHNGASFDPESNIATAHRIYSSSGWQPWGAYTNKSYTRYIQ